VRYRKETLLYEVLMPGMTVSLVHVAVAQQPGSSAMKMKRQTCTLLEETDVMLERNRCTITIAGFRIGKVVCRRAVYGESSL
jgi:hypothetical protein